MKTRSRGFTLLEVMIALVIFAGATVALGSAYINVLNSYEVIGRPNDRREEVRFARAQLLIEPDREKAEEGADFEGANGERVIWRATVEPTNTADLFRVTFTCDIQAAGGGDSRPPAQETFLLLRPTWSDGVDQAKLREEAKERILELKRHRMP